MDFADNPELERVSGLVPTLPVRLGRYTLCEELGSGGMATVYLARMELTAGVEKLVALKTIHRHLAKERSFVEMFLDEAQIAAQVSHPNVCQTFDFGQVGGTYYIAMEYLIGEPLIEVINRIAEEGGPELLEVLPYLAARVIADAAEGLHAAHEARSPNGQPLHIVHRDVSPQNLFITYEGSVKVVDFGCAKAIERINQTNTGMLKGKVAYSPPEQLNGGVTDARSDIWSLGVCLWEALSLTSLFFRDSAVQAAMAILEEPIPFAADGRRWVPEELAKIAEKALQRDPGDRYQTAREMGRDLRRLITEQGVILESAEVAEWMGYLFDSREEKLRRRAKEVQLIDLSDVEEIPVVASALPPALPEARTDAIVDVVTDVVEPETLRPSAPRVAESAIGIELDEDDPALISASAVEMLESRQSGAGPVRQVVTRAEPVPPVMDDGDEGDEDDRKTNPVAAAGPAARASTPLDERKTTPMPDRERRGAAGWLALIAGLVGLALLGFLAVSLWNPLGETPSATVEPESTGSTPVAAEHQDETGGLGPAALPTPGIDPTVIGDVPPQRDSAEAEEAEEPPPAEQTGAEARAEASSNPTPSPDGSRRRRRSGGAVTTYGSTPSTPPAAEASERVRTVSHAPRPAPEPTPPPEEEPSEPLELRTGTVRVVAPGAWAMVFVGGRQLRTPFERELPAGRHRLRVLPHGELPARYVEVRVRPGERTDLELDIEPAPARP